MNAPSPTRSMAKLFLIPEENAAQVWPLVEPLIERATLYSDGLLNAGDMRKGIEDGSRQLWVIWGDNRALAGLVTEIINDTCFIWAIGGERMSEWLPLHKQLEAWAKANGCDAVHFFGRQGWERVLRHEGYERRLVVMRKEL
jgi:hypothetical protein